MGLLGNFWGRLGAPCCRLAASWAKRVTRGSPRAAQEPPKETPDRPREAQGQPKRRPTRLKKVQERPKTSEGSPSGFQQRSQSVLNRAKVPPEGPKAGYGSIQK